MRPHQEPLVASAQPASSVDRVLQSVLQDNLGTGSRKSCGMPFSSSTPLLLPQLSAELPPVCIDGSVILKDFDARVRRHIRQIRYGSSGAWWCSFLASQIFRSRSSVPVKQRLRGDSAVGMPWNTCTDCCTARSQLFQAHQSPAFLSNAAVGTATTKRQPHVTLNSKPAKIL